MEGLTAIDDMIVVGDYIKEGATRNLNLLRAIHSTVTALRTTTVEARGFHVMVLDMAKKVPGVSVQIPETMTPLLESTEDMLSQLHSLMKMKCAAAKQASELHDGDGVCDAYAEAMSAIHDLHEQTETLRWLVMEHNADLETPVGPAVSDPKEIERYLLTLK